MYDLVNMEDSSVKRPSGQAPLCRFVCRALKPYQWASQPRNDLAEGLLRMYPVSFPASFHFRVYVRAFNLIPAVPSRMSCSYQLLLPPDLLPRIILIV